MKRTCKQCGREFDLTAGEIEFYEAKGLELPKRCKDCRAANKADKEKEEAQGPASGKPAKAAKPAAPKGNGSDSSSVIKKALVSVLAVVIVVVALFGSGAITGMTPGATSGNTSANTAATSNNTTNASAGASSNSSKNSNSSAANAASNASSNKSSASSAKGTQFRTTALLNEHYEKHGRDMGYASAAEYQSAAAAVVADPNALHKTEKEDGDDVYYLEATNDFVIVSTDGYIRTYFRPDSGIAYYNKQ